MCVAPFDLGVMNLTTTEKERGRVSVGSAAIRRKEPVTSNGAAAVKAERRPRWNDGHGGTTATVERPSRQQR
ncbi:uncharacterized protein G2W53_044812 [Senna tora]|uniref:Uncharacterized protein n=1 Tax=Senna tora TaxID=362788 RepID=A0A834SN12_9FABA|nr:uncharacterized protein G2W53_044812 [Senna tora]